MSKKINEKAKHTLLEQTHEENFDEIRVAMAIQMINMFQSAVEQFFVEIIQKVKTNNMVQFLRSNFTEGLPTNKNDVESQLWKKDKTHKLEKNKKITLEKMRAFTKTLLELYRLNHR